MSYHPPIERGAPPARRSAGRKKAYADLCEAAKAEPGEWFSQAGPENGLRIVRAKINNGDYAGPGYEALVRSPEGVPRLYIRYTH